MRAPTSVSGHVPTAEFALDPPPTPSVDVEKASMHRRRAGGRLRAIEPGGLRPLDEEADLEGVLARPTITTVTSDRPIASPSLDAARHVDADRRDRKQRAGDDGRVEAAGQDDGHLARDGGGQLRRRAAPGPARERSAGRIEHDPGGPGSQVGPRAFDGRGGGLGHGRDRIIGALGRQVEHLPGRPLVSADGLGWLHAVELERVEVEATREARWRRRDRDRP